MDDRPEREVRSETELMLKGYGLTTAEFLYRMPGASRIAR
jgi:uncharacterized protein Usg